MRQEIFKQLRIALMLFGVLTVLTGVIYPLIITVIAQLLFPWQANGSLIIQNNKIVGSTLIGQAFSADNYFWGRPSATRPFPYNAANSAGSNMGPTNADYLTIIKERSQALQQSNPQQKIPVDLVTASASGLDAEISPQAAYYQAPRIAKARNVPENQINQLIHRLIKSRMLGLLGEPRVNVLELNLTLDQEQSTWDKHARTTT